MHLPNGILNNLEELIELAREFPRARLVVAHMGVVYCYVPDFDQAMAAIQPYNNIYLDTAMVSDSRVIAKAFETIGPNRILFGSDAPFSYLRGGYTINPAGQRRLYSQTKYNWVSKEDRRHYTDRLDSLKLIHLNIVSAIKQAMEALAPASHNKAKDDIFWRNGSTLFRIN
jgi:predicted TIM-barrel fold metal-dependent hydrolase